MKTPPPDKQPAGETLEQIANRICRHYLDSERVSVTQFCDIEAAIVQALRNRDERAVRIIDEHQAMDVCEDNCWTTIKAAIREGSES